MSYYTLPKKIIDLDFNPVMVRSSNIDPVISFSLYNYSNVASKQLKQIKDSDSYILCAEEDNILNFLIKIINPYEFIFTKVPNSKLSVSKLKPHSNLFYILMEITSIFNLLDGFIGRNLRTLSYGNNADSVIEFMNMLREDDKDVHFKSSIQLEKGINLLCEPMEQFRSELFDIL
jgi:hypothetical protein